MEERLKISIKSAQNLSLEAKNSSKFQNNKNSVALNAKIMAYKKN